MHGRLAIGASQTFGNSDLGVFRRGAVQAFLACLMDHAGGRLRPKRYVTGRTTDWSRPGMRRYGARTDLANLRGHARVMVPRSRGLALGEDCGLCFAHGRLVCHLRLGGRRRVMDMADLSATCAWVGRRLVRDLRMLGLDGYGPVRRVGLLRVSNSHRSDPG